jgi:hypothetical protein
MVTISFTVLPLAGDTIDTSGADLSPLSSSQDQNSNNAKNIAKDLMPEIYIKQNYNIAI